MEFIVKELKRKNRVVQACQLKWNNSWIFIIDAAKGTITCGSFDLEALNSFGLPAAKVFPEPGKESHTIEEFIDNKITHVNDLALKLGIKVNLSIEDAIEILS